MSRLDDECRHRYVTRTRPSASSLVSKLLTVRVACEVSVGATRWAMVSCLVDTLPEAPNSVNSSASKRCGTRADDRVSELSNCSLGQ